MSEPVVLELDADAPNAPITDGELHELLLHARTSDDARPRRLRPSYVTPRRVMSDVIAFIEARDGGAAAAGIPLLLRARQLAGAPRRLPGCL